MMETEWTEEESRPFRCGIWDFKGGIGGLQFCGKSQPSLVAPNYDSVSDFSVFPLTTPCFFPVIYCHYVTRLLSVPPHIYRTTSWFSPPQFCAESNFSYHGDEKRGSEGASSNSSYFWNAESGIVMCFLCQGRQKMSEQVRVCCWAACQLSPFAVTRHPVWHYSGSLWVVSSPLSFGWAG